jgi:hypothetical protein
MMGYRDNRRPPRDTLLRMGIKGIAGGIGLASESIKARKASKSPMPDQGRVPDLEHREQESGIINAPPSYSQASGQTSGVTTGISQYPNEKAIAQIEDEAEKELEEEWLLDDAQDGLYEASSSNYALSDITEEDHFLQAHQTITPTQSRTGRLSQPVILPQRRPKGRTRGFIRAYAPALMECGIDQATWLDFLESFQKSSATNPWLNAMNLAGIATAFIPNGLGIIAGAAIHTVTWVAIEMQSRDRYETLFFPNKPEFY